MGELLEMIMTMVSLSRREVPLAESARRRAKVLLPKFRLETAVLRPESPLLIFFLGQRDQYTRRRAPEVGWAGHHPEGRAWGAWRALVGGGPLWLPSGSYSF